MRTHKDDNNNIIMVRKQTAHACVLYMDYNSIIVRGYIIIIYIQGVT